jgi:hypothetical protein
MQRQWLEKQGMMGKHAQKPGMGSIPAAKCLDLKNS